VVQEAGGAVEVAPGPEGGTRFSCWFPLLTEEEAAFLSSESTSDPGAGGAQSAAETFVRGESR